MNTILHSINISYLGGLLTLPLVFVVLQILARQSRAWLRWYKGTPFLSLFGMWLIVQGLKLVTPKHCAKLTANGRYWLSPNVKAFLIQ